MKVDLLELLRSKSIVHPTTITSLNLSEARLIVSLTGHAWWQQRPAPEEASYEFHFEDVSEGGIDATLGSLEFGEKFSEALEYFFIKPLTDVGWAQPQTCQIFCSGPLKYPLALYSKLEKHLDEAESFKQPKDFLNCGQSGTPLATLAKIVSENSFLLACAPEEICTVLTAELERQGVPHNIVRRTDARVESRLHVRLDNSDFLCRSASAILPD
jgi:hypothetical protein